MTAAKVMDIISRLPGCAGQAADAVSAKTQVKMEDARTLLKIPMSECPRYLDTSTETQVAKIMVQYGRPSRSSWKESVRSSFGRTIMGKTIWESSIGTRLGKSSESGDPTSSLDDVYIWVALKENVKLVMILCIITEECSNLGFLPGLWKKFQKQSSPGNLMPKRYLSWSYDMEGHAKKCVERYCELANKKTQPLYQVATPCMDDDHQFREEEIGSVWELPTVCSQRVLKCLYLARIGRPEKFWPVNKQTCSCGHKVDKLLWQTLGAFHLVHSSYKWIPAILLCGKHSTTMQTRIVSRLWLCRRLWTFKINFRRCLVCCRKSHVRANKLDVQETNLSFSLLMQVYACMGFPLSIFGIWWLKYFILHQTKPTNPKSANTQINMQKQIATTHTNLDLTNIDHVPSSGTHSGSNEAVTKMIIKRPKSHSETCVKNPQSCFGLVVWQD